jgi:hypothetical protein
MATLSGQVAFTVLHDFMFAQSGVLPAAVTGGARTRNIPVPIVSSNLSGDVVPMYGERDWFDRLHVIPSMLDVGVLRSSIEEEIALYNASRQSAEIDDVDFDGQGMGINHPQTPYNLQGKTSESYILSISLTGPSRIDASIQFNGATVGLLQILGRRIIADIWDIKPNWQQPVTEWFRWRTDIQLHHDGTETRRAVLQNPHRGLDFDILTKNINRLDQILSGWQSQYFNVPRWPDVTYMTSAVNAGALSIDIDTSIGEWIAGEQVVLLHDGVSEAPVVNAVREDGLDFVAELENSWPAGTAVYPARLMRLSNPVNIDRQTAGVAVARIQFEATRYTKTTYAEQESVTTFDGVPVYLVAPNRRNVAALGYMRDLVQLQNPIGVTVVDDINQTMTPLHQWQYLFKTRADIDAFIQWLFVRQGRYLDFYYPTFSQDFKIVSASLLSGVAELDVEPVNWAKYYQNQPQRKTIALQDVAGVWRFANIQGASIAGGIETFVMDRAWVPVDEDPIPVANIKRACWLERVRLDADRIELQWVTAGVVETGLPFRGVKA